MPDISACNGGSCPLRLHCYRYTCEKEELGQTYFIDPPYKMSMILDDVDVTLGVVTVACPYFWNNAQYKKDEKSTNN